jgi:hypothetical protein
MFPVDSRNPYNVNTGVAKLISAYGGWNLKASRLWQMNANYDPWRPATVASSQSGVSSSSVNTVLPKAIHAWDLIAENWVSRR